MNDEPRDELLNGKISYSLKKTPIVIENRRRYDTTVRPHSLPGYRPPAPSVLVWPDPKKMAKLQSLN